MILNPMAEWRLGREIVSLLTRHRQLTWELTKRELTEQHAGQVLGALWTIGHPLALMIVYVFLFTVVFQARIDSRGLSVPLDFAVYILAGLLPWLIFQQVMGKGTSAILGNSTLVKQVVFPIEILPFKSVLASVGIQIIFFVLLIGYVLFRFQAVPWTYALIPVLMFVQATAMAGVCYAFAAVGCFVRDLKEVVTVFSVANLFLMPVVYLPEWVPPMVRPILYLNPFSYMIWCYQDALFYGSFRHPWAWFVFPALSFVGFSVGYRIFRKLKIQFGNVL